MNDIQNKILSLAQEHGTDVLYAAETIIKEQAARIASLEQGMRDIKDYAQVINPAEIAFIARKRLGETPQQSLAAIQADAVEWAMDDQFPDLEDWNQHEWTVYMCRIKLKRCIKTLRDKASQEQ